MTCNNHININTEELPIFWVMGEQIVAPAPNTVLVRHKCLVGTKTFIHGLRVSSTDFSGNIFALVWTHKGKIVTFAPDIFPANGTIHLQNDNIPFNGRYPADVNSDILLIVINNGNAGSSYYGDILIREELIA